MLALGGMLPLCKTPEWLRALDLNFGLTIPLKFFLVLV